MEGYLIALIIVVYMVALFAFMYASTEVHGVFAIAVVFWIILGLGFAVQSMLNENKKGPCVEYKTQMHFNAATKTIMPMRVCVNRGEWVRFDYMLDDLQKNNH